MSGMLPLSIIVVTWNCRELALACLRSVSAAPLPPGAEIIVVDNASADGTPEAVSRAFPGVRVIANSENAGFAVANNQAIAAASGEYLLLLNPDAFARSEGAFASMLDFLRARPDFAAVGCRLVFPDGRHQVGDAGFRPCAASVLSHALGLSHLTPRARGVFLVRPDRIAGGAKEVDWLCGACMMVRAEAVRATGPFDPRFFMYAEDVEWGCRMRAGGWRVGYLPDVEVVHLQGGTQGTAPSARWLESLAGVYCELNGTRGFLAFRAAFALGFAARAALYAVIGLVARRGTFGARSAAMARFARHAWQLRPGPAAA